MKTILFTLFLALVLQAYPQGLDQSFANANRPAYVVFDHDKGPVKIYGAVEDCIKFCGSANEREANAGRAPRYSDQQVNLWYHMPEEGWSPSSRDIIEDYNHPVGLADKFLAQKTVYLVMQEHFDLALRIYLDSTACYRFAGNMRRENGEPSIRKALYFYRVKKSYDEVWRDRESHLKMR